MLAHQATGGQHVDLLLRSPRHQRQPAQQPEPEMAAMLLAKHSLTRWASLPDMISLPAGTRTQRPKRSTCAQDGAGHKAALPQVWWRVRRAVHA